jgi:1-aminocyclopropane-1-carboxylate deaminase
VFHPSKIEKFCIEYFNFNPNIDILRDDLIHPIVSGNKWRKLKYIIEDFEKSGKKTLVTFGGAYSNHLIATAVACQLKNIASVGFVRGDEIRPMNHYEEICIKNNMKLMHVSRADYRNKTTLFNKYFDSESAYFVDEGGYHPMALKGCEEITYEFKIDYDYIILSLGTGTTMEGITKAIQERKLKTKVIGISSLKNNFELDERMSKYSTDYWQIFHDFHRGKYAKMDKELFDVIEKIYIETGIKTDPIYTAKMIMAVKHLYDEHLLKKGDKVLLIHTGGTQSFDTNQF